MVVKLKDKNNLEQWRENSPLWRWLSKQPPYGRVTRLADRLGLKRQSIYPWLRGDSAPNPDNFPAITEVTGITMDEWMEWWNGRPTPPPQPTTILPRVKKVGSRRTNGR